MATLVMPATGLSPITLRKTIAFQPASQGGTVAILRPWRSAATIAARSPMRVISALWTLP